jgi:hypothetical protein
MSAVTVRKHNRRPLYVELSAPDRAALDRLVARARHEAGQDVSIIEVVRRLVRDADARL